MALPEGYENEEVRAARVKEAVETATITNAQIIEAIEKIKDLVRVVLLVVVVLGVVAIVSTVQLQLRTSAREQTQTAAENALTSSNATKDAVEELTATVDTAIEELTAPPVPGEEVIDPARVNEGLDAMVQIRDWLCTNNIIDCSAMEGTPSG